MVLGTRLLLLVILALSSCAEQADFSAGTARSQLQGDIAAAEGQSETLTNIPDEEAEAIEIVNPPSEEAVEKPTLKIILPSDQLRLGGSQMQVKSQLSSQVEPPAVRYELSVEGQKPLGSIDDAGLYTSPQDGTASYEITITSIWLKDESVRDAAKLKLIPLAQIFVSCVKDNKAFPITADVYTLPPQTQLLPDFSKIAASKVTTVCMDQYAVATRDWSAGFPGLSKLFEWFALQTRTTLVVPLEGSYTFRLHSDDGSKLYIDKQLLIDNDGTHSPTSVDGTVQLAAGDHPLVLDYFQGPRHQIALELFWKKPGDSEFTLVPRSAFK